MKVSNENPVISQERKTDYAPPAFREVINNNSPVINRRINGGNNDALQQAQEIQKSEKELNQLAKEINKLSNDENISLVFSSDKDTGKNVIKFVDQHSKEVVKQIPSEVMLKVAEQIDEFLKKHSKVFPTGFLLNERV
jgi:uncharacterized FlaG/YvyC family protein